MECKGSDGNQGFRFQKTLFVDPNKSLRLGVAIEFKGFYLSIDGGQTWNISSTGLIGYPKRNDSKKPCHTEFAYLEMDTKNSKHLILARAGEPGTIKDYFSENNGLYESKDGGKTWIELPTGAPKNIGVQRISVNPYLWRNLRFKELEFSRWRDDLESDRRNSFS